MIDGPARAGKLAVIFPKNTTGDFIEHVGVSPMGEICPIIYSSLEKNLGFKTKAARTTLRKGKP